MADLLDPLAALTDDGASQLQHEHTGVKCRLCHS